MGRSGERWSDAEVTLALSLRQQGVPASEIATKLGRPVFATQQKLKMLARANMVPPPAAPPRAAPPPAVKAAPAPDPDAPDLAAHVRALPRVDGWTVARDFEFLNLACLNWPEHEIALEISVPSRELKPRLIVLTDGKRFKRVDVLAELRRQNPHLPPD